MNLLFGEVDEIKEVLSGKDFSGMFYDTKNLSKSVGNTSRNLLSAFNCISGNCRGMLISSALKDALEKKGFDVPCALYYGYNNNKFGLTNTNGKLFSFSYVPRYSYSDLGLSAYTEITGSNITTNGWDNNPYFRVVNRIEAYKLYNLSSNITGDCVGWLRPEFIVKPGTNYMTIPNIYFFEKIKEKITNKYNNVLTAYYNNTIKLNNDNLNKLDNVKENNNWTEINSSTDAIKITNIDYLNKNNPR